MPARAFQRILALLMLLPLACSPLGGLSGTVTSPDGGETTPGGAARSTATTPATRTPEPIPPDFYDLEGNPIFVDPPPREAVELMLQQVEAGDLALAEGVIGLLQALAGESALPGYAADGEGEVEFKSGWGLSAMAYEVYQASNDPAVRAEIERLIRKLAPPQEALDLYAAPAEEARSWRWTAGLLKGVGRQLSCDEIWHEGFPESAGPAPTCLLYDSFTAGGHEFRVYYPTELANDPTYSPYFASALQALKRSQEVYSKLVEVRSINLVFALIPAAQIGGPQQGVAMVPGLDPESLAGRPCPITVFTGALDVLLPQFQQIMAHEVFHCINFWLKGGSGYADASWYNEGLANYFSNVVYPDVNLEHKFVEEFHTFSPDKSIFEMSYANTVFFQFLGNRFGDPWLIELVKGMPLTSHEAMMGYLAGLPDFDKVFQEFGQMYMDGKIEDTGKGLLPGEAYVRPEDVVWFPDVSQHRMEARPFHIERGLLLFREDRHYELDLNLQGNGGHESAKDPPDGSWAPMPGVVVACEGLADLVPILTTTSPGAITSTAATFDLDLAESEESECDKCLVGEWEHDIGASEYWDAVRQATADMDTQLQSVLGAQRLIYYEDTAYESHTEDWVLIWRGSEFEGNVSVVITTTQRSARGVYGTAGLAMLNMWEGTSNYRQETVVQVTGPLGTFSSNPEVRTEDGGGFAPTPPGGAPYTCTDTTLSYAVELQVFGGGGQVWSGDIIYDRISTTPPPPSLGPEN